MPPYIQPYQSQERVEAVNPREIVLPQVRDIGGAFTQMAGQILDAARPHAREAAERQALEDAGRAEIVKDEHGNFVRANLTKGGGLVYSKVYSDALDVRHADLLRADYEARLTPLAIEYRRDPARFTQEAAGLAEGMLEAAPPTVRGRVEGDLIREMSERARGIAFRQAEEQHANLLRGLGEIYDATVVQELDIREMGIATGLSDSEVEARLAPILARRGEVGIKLLELGGVAGEGLEARDREIEARTGGLERRQLASSNLQLFAPVLGQIPNDPSGIPELETLRAWLGGLRTDETVAGLTFDDIGTLFPDGATRSQVEQFVARKIGHIKEAELERKRLEQETPPETAGEVISRHEDADWHGSGLSKEEVAGANEHYVQSGGGKFVGEQLADPTGQGTKRTLGFFATYGTMPLNTTEALSQMILGTDMPKAVDFIQQARTFQKDGREIGQLWFQALPPLVRSVVAWDETMRRAGLSDTRRVEEIVQMAKGENPSTEDAARHFGGMDGYRAKMRDTFARHLNIQPNEAAGLVGFWEDEFDTLMRVNLSLYKSPSQALEMTGRQMANGWQPTPYSVDRMIDSRLGRGRLDAGVLDAVFANTPQFRDINPDKVKWGERDAKGQPLIKLRALHRSPGTQFGYYEVYVYDRNGNGVRGHTTFLMDDLLRTHDRVHARAKKRRAELEKAKAEPPRTILTKHPKTGVLGLFINPEWEAWRDRQKAEEAARAERGRANRVGNQRANPMAGPKY